MSSPESQTPGTEEKSVKTLFMAKINDRSDAKYPVIKTSGSAGYDLYSSEAATIEPRGQAIIPTGIAVKIPNGCVGLIWPRSGLSAKFRVETGAGVIDSDYTGEIKVILYNHSDEPVELGKHERVAQMVVTPCYNSPPEAVYKQTIDMFAEKNERGDKGFGSSGMQ